MNVKRQSIALLVLAFVMGLSPCTKVMAQGVDAPVQNQKSQPLRQPPYDSTSDQAKAMQIALERYRLVKRICSKFGYYPLFYSFATGCDALFPVGRSDRLYLYIWGAEFWRQKDGDAVLCYQRKAGRYKLVYTVNLKEVAAPANKVPRVQNLLDYIRMQGGSQNVNDVTRNFIYVIGGKISHYAESDLAINRDYSEYEYGPYNSTLHVRRTSDYVDGELPDEKWTAPGYIYELPMDDPDKFYRKYGLPIAMGELSGINNNP